jgi:hypothetical protein
LLFAFLILIICSSILPVLSLQSNIGISSYGTINHATTQLLTLHVDGKYLKDSSGNKVILRGVTYKSEFWYGSSLGAEQYTYMKNWGCNCVRIDVQCFTLEGSHGSDGRINDQNLLTSIDNQVSWATNAGLYVIFSGFFTNTGPCPHNIPNNHLDHYMTVDWTWTQWVNLWDQYATRYASYQNVMYELINEPLYVSRSDYQTHMRAAIDQIRTHNANAICVVQESGYSDWDTCDFQFEQTNPINRANVLYSLHLYSYHMVDNSQSAIRTKLGSNGAYTHYADWMLANGRCVISTEFGDQGTGQDYQIHYNDWAACASFSTPWLNNFMTVFDTDGYSGYTCETWDTYTLLSDWNGNPNGFGTVIKTYYLSH